MMQPMNMSRAQAAQRAGSPAFKETYQEGLRCKGFRFSVPAGNSNFSLQLSGMAYCFKGIAFYNFTNAGLTTQLVINNDVVIESSDARFFEVNGDANARETYPFIRALNGQDTITLSFVNTAALVDVSVLVYYY
jgi:hypothetical protein